MSNDRQIGSHGYRTDGSLIATINRIRRGPDLVSGAVEAVTPRLTGASYDMQCSVDCVIRIGVAADDAVLPALSLANGIPLTAGNAVTFNVWDGSTIGVISATPGVFQYWRVS